jgi:Family of unknown function (DUF5994)
VNGSLGARRCASPVRLTLNGVLGADIDGAWWPHSAGLARELPELIEALHPILGEIVDIKLNWSSTPAPTSRQPLSAGSMSLLGWSDRRLRLMLVAGQTQYVKLLVVPSSAKAALGRTVSRLAASMPVAAEEMNSPVVQTANSVMRAARAESALWAASAGSGHGELAGKV